MLFEDNAQKKMSILSIYSNHINVIFPLSVLNVNAFIYKDKNDIKNFEAYYQQKHCQGEREAMLYDRISLDCLTDSHAIEYDFDNKWHKAISHSLGYAVVTGKRAGIVLILKTENDVKYWNKLNSVITDMNLPIDTWYVSQ